MNEKELGEREESRTLIKNMNTSEEERKRSKR